MNLVIKLKRFFRRSFINNFFSNIIRWRNKIPQLKYILLSYILIIFIFSLLLWSPVTQTNPSENWTNATSYVNALFTTASAFSDTGLAVYDTFSHWNMLGQSIIAILILMGGVGIFALKFFVLGYLFQRNNSSVISVKMLQSERGSAKFNQTTKLVIYSVKFLLITILISGFLMSFYFYFVSPIQTKGIELLLTDASGQKKYIDPTGDWSLAFRFGFFHTISAINNAGFDIISGNSLLPYYQNYFLQIWFIILLIIGGIGYPALYDIKRYIRHKLNKNKEKYRFTLFTKISIISYFLIFVVGLIMILSFELTSYGLNDLWNKYYIPSENFKDYLEWLKYSKSNSVMAKEMLSDNFDSSNLEGIHKQIWDLINKVDSKGNSLKTFLDYGHLYGSKFDRIFALVFSAFSTRSAGFATINMRHLTHGSSITIIIMMFIGAAPSSTGGGIRTTTFAILILTIYSVLVGNSRVRIFKRSIETKTVFMSTQVFVIALLLLIVATMFLITSLDTYGGLIPTSELLTEKDELNIYRENYQIEHLLFEVASAFGTTGLSSGITKNLNNFSKIMIILIMFIGQFGISSTLLVWKRKKSKDRNYEYIDSDVAIG
ncbi:TrkH family potassium uptake protein [Mycoplasma sp. CSL10137]|uniref:potassium transporter TrkG n=1 Tax=unclassified Mycoplasma TaxID=2683645 RepID=UPI00197CAA62|nr:MULTISPECIES: potassium transporter TrkG [unclassified Mycoplasma]MBN4083262.1 TrkH family potassium uptake protein [Mycoplasma sp. CSL10137]MBN4084437.1 TrkH family potassium uptake protein [Mycoplasma sp. CSL10166]MBU4692922.1 TrkH family potassium uptake protein [Mycoplasma sp. CSL7491-lung]